MTAYTIDGATRLPDDETPLAGTWQLYIATIAGTAYGAAGSIRAGILEAPTDPAGVAAVTVPESGTDDAYIAVFAADGGNLTLGPYGPFKVTAPMSWSDVIDTPILTPTPPDEFTALQDAVKALQLAGATPANDTATASFVTTTGAATRGALDTLYARVTEAPLYPFRGAAYDGANAKAALDAAILAASQPASTTKTVWVPNMPGGILTDAPTLKSGVKLVGERGAVLKMRTAAARFINLIGLTNVTLEGFTIDLDGKPTTSGIAIGAGTARTFLRRINLVSSTPTSAGVNGLAIEGGSTDTTVEHLDSDGLDNTVRIYGDAARVHLYRPRIRNWRNRGITILGDATNASRWVTLEEIDIADFDSANGGPQRQPVAVQGAGAFHRDLTVRGGRLVGNAVPHHVGTDGGTLLGGTADQLSMHYCQDFAVIGTEVIDGGEVGILAAWGSNGGVIEACRSIGNNTSGVCLEGGGAPISDIAVVGNVLRNNGRELGSTPAYGGSGTPRQGAKGQLWCKFSAGGIIIEGNTFSGPSDTYALYLKDNPGEIQIGFNSVRGVAAVTDPANTNNTAARFGYVPAETTVLGADTAPMFTSTLANMPAALSRNLEAYADYDFEAVIGYTTNGVATGTPGLKVSFAALAGASVTWYPDSSGSNGAGAPTTTTNSNRSFFTAIGATAAAGGVTGAQPARMILRGRFKTTSVAGALQLTAAQQTTDAVNGTVIVAGSSLTTWRRG